jgi:hypothetical protein
LRNYDVDRALELLEQIRITCVPDVANSSTPGLKVVK